MKLFTKVALVTAMAISANAMAAQLQSLDDEALSATTGQDGITLTLNTSGITIDKLLIHDNDGLETLANGGFVALTSANTALQTLVDTAQTGLNTAQSNLVTANNAVVNAQNALAAAQAALAADPGNTTLQGNVTTAQNTLTTAQGAQTTAQGAVTTAQGALNTAQTNYAATPTVSTNRDLGGTETAGAIVLNKVGLNIAGNTVIKLDTDAGDDGSGNPAPFLNIGVNTGTVNLTVDNISVGASGAIPTSTGTNRRGVLAGSEVTILSGYNAAQKIDITLGQTAMNIQLGHAPQGAMILASGTVTNGIEIKNLAIVDSSANGGGAIGIDRIRITDAYSNDLSANAQINATSQGLRITTTGSAKKDIYMDAVRLGSLSNMDAAVVNRNASIGAVEIQGLDMGTSSIFVSGH